MSSAHAAEPFDIEEQSDNDEAAMLDPDEAAEEIADNDGDAAMDSGEEDEDDDDQMQEEMFLQNDSSAHFDKIPDAIFAIAQHPLLPQLIAVGGSEGEDAGGIGYIFDSTPMPVDRPVLPESYNSGPPLAQEREGIEPLFKLEGHTDSINALAFTLPKGEFLLSGGLDGKLRAYVEKRGKWAFAIEAQEVEEVNWLAACPNEKYPNIVAFGGNDGSVWVYTATATELQIVQSYFMHTGSSTAGSWSADGKLLATVSDDGSLYVWDVFGEAAGAGVGDGGQYVVGLTAEDQRFAVDGGLYSVAIAPTGAFVVVGGAGGAMKVVGLPRLGGDSAATGPGKAAKGGKKAAGGVTATTGQSGQILADLNTQTDGIETIAFARPPLTLFAAGSVDGSIALYDSAHRFAVRRHIKEAHEDFSVVKIEFGQGWELTSCGMDGVVRRWDTRGGTAVANSGFMAEWKGHRGGGEGGGVLDFVQGGERGRIVTAGDDGLSLIFEA